VKRNLCPCSLFTPDSGHDPNRNFLIALTIKHEGTEQPRVRSIAGRLDSWLESLDPDDVLADIESATERGELAVVPELDLEVRDWVLTFKAWPNAPDKRYGGGRLLGALPASGAFVEANAERIYKAVKDKGGHYGELGALDKWILRLARAIVPGLGEPSFR
jgi:hypothetical protein